jgi:apolipoprotein N-acyltransferase
MQTARAPASGRSTERKPALRPDEKPKRRLDLRALARAAALPTLSGVLYFLSWIGFGIWPLAFVCLVPLLVSLKDTDGKGAMWRGAWMGFVTHLGGYTWLIHLLKAFAFLPLPLAFVGYVLVCAFQGFLFGVFALVLRWAWLRTNWPLVILAPLALMATEFVYPLLFQSYTGGALMPLLPLMQVLDLGGSLLSSALVALSCGAMADVLLGSPQRRLAALITTAAVFAAAGGYGRWRMSDTERREREAPKRRSAVAQPNIGEVELHKNPYASVRMLRSQTAEAHARAAELVVWPEVGFNVAQVNLDQREAARVIQAGVPIAIIAGIERVDGKGGRFNSAVMISRKAEFGQHFDKIQLLAFGEYIPFGDVFPVVYKWSPMSSHLTRGTSTEPLKDGSFSYATFICYEDILPGIVRSIMADRGQGRPQALVNLTNDSWYGKGHEQEQHLQLAAMRSIEHHRWMLRATSTGISAFIDASGRVVGRIPRDTSGVAVRDVPMLLGETLYQKWGDWPGWLSIAALAGGILFARRRVTRPAA